MILTLIIDLKVDNQLSRPSCPLTHFWPGDMNRHKFRRNSSLIAHLVIDEKSLTNLFKSSSSHCTTYLDPILWWIFRFSGHLIASSSGCCTVWNFNSTKNLQTFAIKRYNWYCFNSSRWTKLTKEAGRFGNMSHGSSSLIKTGTLITLTDLLPAHQLSYRRCASWTESKCF